MNIKSITLRKVTLILLLTWSFFRINCQTNPFMADTGITFKERVKILLWADLDNDGLKDAIAYGNDEFLYRENLLFYKNNGNKLFTKIDTVFPITLSRPIVNCADFDNNGLADLIILANIYDDVNPDYRVYIYQNKGNWTFDKVEMNNITGGGNGNVSVTDFNNDGKTDFLICGQNAEGRVFSSLYKNSGQLVFSYVPTSFITVRNGSSSWADFDRDGFTDLLTAGEVVTPDNQLIPSAKVYKNNRNGTFSVQSDINLPGIRTGEAKWGDYNNDGNLDILVYGSDNYGQVIKIFDNDSNGRFTEANIIGSEKIEYSTAEWEDFDNDGDLDLFYFGLKWDQKKNKWNPLSFLYTYDNVYIKSTMSIDYFDEIYSVNADIDNDNDLDIIYSGLFSDSRFKTHSLINNSVSNTAPSVPQNLMSVQKGKRVLLNWDKSFDSETNHNLLSYNIRIGTTPGGFDVFSPPADTINGNLWMFEPGKLFKTDSGYTVKNLMPGKYYWSVQAIDMGYKASDFSPEDSFMVDSVFVSPEAPVDFQSFVISENLIDLTWVYPNGDETGFLIERSEEDALNFKVIDSVGGYIYYYRDKNLQPSKKYYYRIRTQVDDFISEYSDTIYSETWKIPILSKVFENELVYDKLKTTCAAWGDFNNDSWMDLCVTNNFASTHIFMNQGDGNFYKTSLDDGSNAQGVNWIDINNDGFLDLFLVAGFMNPNVIYLNNGDGTFTKDTLSNLGVDMGETQASCWGDFDKDGLVDVFICNFDSTNKLYRNLGNLRFESFDFGEKNKQTMNSVGCNWVDYNNDGFQDIFVANYYLKNCLYKNVGGKYFEKVTAGSIVNDAEPSVSGTWGDFDNDGDMDLLVANNVNTDNSFYENMSDGSFSKSAVWPFANRTGIYGAGNGASWEDIDNDGDLDLFIANAYNNQLYINNGDGEFTAVTDEPFCRDYGYSESALWADYNNDGNIDLFIPNYGQANYLYKNNGFPLPVSLKSTSTKNNRVFIRLKGRKSNSYGLAAKVLINSGDNLYVRNISSQSGAFTSTDNLIVSVGISQNDNANVTVQWPSGLIQNVTSVQLNKINVIEEPDANDIDRTEYTDLRIFPNPANTNIIIASDHLKDCLSITISDVSGRIIKKMPINLKESHLSIDVSDISTGIYLLNMESKAGNFVAKFYK